MSVNRPKSAPRPESPPTSPQRQFHYLRKFTEILSDADLAALGTQGWELVTVYRDQHSARDIAIFKQEITK